MKHKGLGLTTFLGKGSCNNIPLPSFSSYSVAGPSKCTSNSVATMAINKVAVTALILYSF